MSRRHAGVAVPLFALRSSASWGIGELSDLVPFTAWMHAAALDRVMLLPLGAMERGQTSPYSATSTLAIDPIYIALDRLSDFERAGGVERLSLEARGALASARAAHTVRHDLVRRAKDEALAIAFQLFLADEWEQLTPRAAALARYVARERWWLDDFAVFQAIAAARDGVSWRDWPLELRERQPRAIDDARRQLSRDVLLHQYTQWVAETQWQETRGAVHALGVEVFGDLPFVANDNSPEVWARVSEFQAGVSAGVPPDAFSPTGQDWGLPTYAWPAIAQSGYAWFRQRGRRMAALYDGVRVDHVVGLYRTYGRPRTGEPFFTPADEFDQRRQGEAVLSTLREEGMILIAEDLGLVPDFVRESLESIGVPGCKVMRWERDWHTKGAPYFPPADYAASSAAMTGTHDTEPMAAWWRECGPADRRAFLALPLLDALDASPTEPAWNADLRDGVLSLMYRSGSRDVFVPIADLFGWADRINTPGTVSEHNWTWVLPWPVDAMPQLPEAVERARFLCQLAAATGRAPGLGLH